MLETFDRKFGMYEMSIPTSLAFEGLTCTGEYEARAAFGPPPITQFDAVYVNIRTLIRNAQRAFSTQEVLFTNDKLILEIVIEDLQAIIDLMDQQANKLKVVPYICEHTNLETRFPNSTLKGPSSAKDNFLHGIEIEVLIKLENNTDFDIKQFKNELTGTEKCVVLTHVPMDLMSFSNFPKFELLESHTGVVKSRDKWNTKLSKFGKDNNIPFILPMLQIFGDDVTFASKSISFKRKLAKISEKRGWHSMTTRDKVLADIRLENDRELLDEYMKFI